MKLIPARYIIGECQGGCCDRLLSIDEKRRATIDHSGKKYDTHSEKNPFKPPACEDIENLLVGRNSPLQPEL